MKTIGMVAFSLVLFHVADSAGAVDTNTEVPDTGIPRQGAMKFNVSVRDETTESVQFQLRPKGAEWTTYTLSSGEKGVYSCVGCGGTFEITISTAGTVVTYDIATGGLYAIRVNDSRRVFDVYKIQ
jgi:hypothetical protein